MYSKRVSLHSSVRNSFDSLLRGQIRYKEVLEELDSGNLEIEKYKREYRKMNGLLVVHQTGHDEEDKFWKIAVPDDVDSRNLIVNELHCVP